MNSSAGRSAPKAVKFGADEKYTRIFSAKYGSASALRSGKVVLAEGENVGRHNTGGFEEVIIVLEGQGELLTAGGEKLGFEKDTALYIPPDTEHDVKNTGRGLLKYVYVTCPCNGYPTS